MATPKGPGKNLYVPREQGTKSRIQHLLDIPVVIPPPTHKELFWKRAVTLLEASLERDRLKALEAKAATEAYKAQNPTWVERARKAFARFF